MRRGARVPAVLVLVALLLAGAWLVAGPRLQTYYVLRQCQAAWQEVNDLQSDFSVEVGMGPVGVPVRGTMWYQRPDRYRIDFGGSGASCQVIGRPDGAWVYVPAIRLAADIRFKQGSAADVLRRQSPEQWVEQLAGSTEPRVERTATVEGQKCWVVEFMPTPEQRRASAPALLPGADRQARPAEMANDWRKTRVYISRKSHLPVRAEALAKGGDLVFAWTAETTFVNQGIPEGRFEFTPPEGAVTLERDFDPERPETLFLPPEVVDRGGSWDDVVGVLEDVMKDKLKDLIGNTRDRVQEGSDEVGDFLRDLKDRLEAGAEEPEPSPEPAPEAEPPQPPS